MSVRVSSAWARVFRKGSEVADPIDFESLRAKAPNAATFLLLTFPAIAPVILSLAAAEHLAGAGLSALLLAVATGLVAAIPVAARIERAPRIASAIVFAGWLIGMFLAWVGAESGTGGPFSDGADYYAHEAEWRYRAYRTSIYLAALGAGISWVRRDVYVRPFDSSRLLGWALEGFAELIRPGSTHRALAGLGAMGVGTLIVSVGLSGLLAGDPAPIVVWGARVPLIGGLAAVLSSLRLPEAEVPETD